MSQLPLFTLLPLFWPSLAIVGGNLGHWKKEGAGSMEEAKGRLRHAINLDKDIRRLALDDKDLRPLWDWIGRATS